MTFITNACVLSKLFKKLPDEVIRYEVKADPADHCVVRGHVLGEEEEPLIGAYAIITDSENELVHGASVDLDGFYEIHLEPQHYRDSLWITFRYIAYRDFKMPIESRGLHELDVQLKPLAIEWYD
jgi:hypothetical protein